MQDVPLDGELISMVGALDFDRSATGVVPRRLPAWTQPQIPDLFMDVIVQSPSGVRLRFASTSTTIELEVMLTLLRQLPWDLRPAVFDLVVDGELSGQATTTSGTVITLTGPAPEDITIDPGEPTVIRFDGLAPARKVIEVWLPQGAVVELRAVRVDDDAQVEAVPEPAARRWVHYGSSISHCLEADSPTSTWPVIAARSAGVELTNLGLAGQCMLDQFVARTIRDLPADVISLKVGINVVNGDTLRERTFGPALHGFLDTIREGRPDTPILLVSPIFCPSAGDKPGPTIPGPDGLEHIRRTSLTLRRIRALAPPSSRCAGDWAGGSDKHSLPDRGLHASVDLLTQSPWL